MKIIYAFRSQTWHPHHGDRSNLVPASGRAAYLKKVKEIGYVGLELGAGLPDGKDSSEANIKEFRKELEDAGLPCVGIRGGGGLAHPKTAAGNRKRLESNVRFAAAIGAKFLNTTTGGPPRDPSGPGTFVGEPVSQGSSRMAREEDYERTAKGLAEVADIAADLGVDISIEIHQHSISDNSWSALHLLDLIDRPNVFINPDLGNILWCYDVPEETCEAAIVALAPRSKYWHCKNLTRVHIPENKHAIFLQAALPDGDINYRFALSAMVAAGAEGPIAVEGLRLGDQIEGDRRSAEYMNGMLEELGAV